MGIHIDGYIATSAHTVIIACSPNNVPTTGPKADVICAAFYACQVASRLVKPGNNSTHVRNAINRIASTFHCQPCDQTASYSVERYIIDGDQCIPNTPIGQQQLDGNTATTTELIAPEHCYNNNEEFEFLPNSVYTINAVMTTSPTGATRDSPIHTAGLAQRGELAREKDKEGRNDGRRRRRREKYNITLTEKKTSFLY